jgi:hypothetical protein
VGVVELLLQLTLEVAMFLSGRLEEVMQTPMAVECRKTKMTLILLNS